MADLKIGVTLYTHRFDEPPDDRARYRVVAHRRGGVLTGPWDWKRIAGRLASSLRSHEVLFVHNHPATLWYRSLQEMGGAPPAVLVLMSPVSLYGLAEGKKRRPDG
jgi:hypothetical protein